MESIKNSINIFFIQDYTILIKVYGKWKNETEDLFEISLKLMEMMIDYWKTAYLSYMPSAVCFIGMEKKRPLPFFNNSPTLIYVNTSDRGGNIEY